MSDPMTPKAQASEAAVSLTELRDAVEGNIDALTGLARNGLGLSEFANPAVQRALIDATMLDAMLNAEKEGKDGMVTDYKERRTAAVQLAKMKGFDTGESKRSRVMEEINKIKAFMNAEVVVPPTEPE